MSGAPPGYNPDTSMLAGGTGEIMKVMGGGGMPPSGYNSSASMLDGGQNAVIEKIMEGGVVTFSNTPQVREVPMTENNLAARGRKSSGTNLKAVSGTTITTPPIATAAPAPAAATAPPPAAQPKASYSPFQVEVYSPVIDSQEEERHKSFILQYESNVTSHPIWLETYQELVDTFKENAFKHWWRIDSAGKKQAAILPTKTQCAQSKNIKGYHSLLQILPKTTENIVIIPPIKGDILLFQKYLQFLLDNGVLNTNADKDLIVKEGSVVVCLAPFFDESSKEQRGLLYSTLLLLNWNPQSFYVLRDENAIGLGCGFYEGINAREAQGKDVLPNSLFPSFLSFPHPFGKYEGLLFTNEQGKGIPAVLNSRFKPLTEIRESVAFPVGINPTPFFSNYFTVSGKGVPTTIPSSRLDIPICKSLDSLFYDLDISKDVYTITSGKNLYIIRLGKIKQIPLLCTDEQGNPQGLLPSPGAFKGDEINPEYDHGESSVTVLIDGIPRKFRMPHDLNKVRDNWEKGIYSNSEAAFLNYLNLTPFMLSQIFSVKGNQNTWLSETAKFLENLVASKCFEDTHILTDSRCEDTRMYLNTIVQYFFSSSAAEDVGPLKKLGVPVQSAPLGATLIKGTTIPVDQIIPIEWPAGLVPLEDGKDFEKAVFGDLTFRENIKNNTLQFDLIVIHKKTGQYKFMSIPIRGDRIEEGTQTSHIGPENQIAEALEELKKTHSDFVFVY